MCSNMSSPGVTRRMKQKRKKRGENYCFNHTKPFHRPVVESSRVLGESFLFSSLPTLNTILDAQCCVFIPRFAPHPVHFLVLF